MGSGRPFSAFGVRFRYARGAYPWSRLGLTVGRKAAAKAVRRNRLRRLLREGYRLTKDRLPCPVDVVAIPLPGTVLTVERAHAAFVALADAIARRPPEGSCETFR